MTTARSIVCGSCGSDVPYGRLSCPSCGDLLASVAGGRRRDSGAATVGSATAGSATSTAAAAVSGGERIPPSVLHDASEPSPMASLAFDDEPLASARESGVALPADDAPMRAAPAWIAPGGVVVGGLFDDTEPEPGPEPGPATALHGAEAAAIDPAAAVASEDDDEPLSSGAFHAPDAPPPIVDGGQAADAPSFPPPPGSYVPPVAAFGSGAAVATYAVPGGPAAPARAWAGHGAANSMDPDEAAAALPAAGAVDGARLTEFVGWLAIAGGALAAVGFLLPWGASMIGATGVGYIDRWGLAGPFHVVVALAVVALVVSVIVPNPLPAWVRIGLGGTVLGVFLLGLVWPYVFGFSGTGPGALAVGLGAVALVAAGITSLTTDRHARGMPPV